jgi:hypothetical protein
MMKYAGLLSLVLGSAAGTALFAFATGAGAEKSKAPDAVVEAETKADAALEKFQKQNPDCLAWTDWQKTCSKLDVNGLKVHCNKTVVPAKRSAVFCLATRNKDFTGTPYGGKLKTASAFNRYCTAYKTIKGKKICMERENQRPFSGFNFLEVRHPYCKMWINSSGAYCSEDEAKEGWTSCSDMDHMEPSSSKLTCSMPDFEKVNAAGCSGMKQPELYRTPQFLSDDNNILTMSFNRAIAPVASTYCKKWR